MQQKQFIDLQDQLNMFRAIFCPSSGDQYIVIVAPNSFLYITLPTLMMHGQTQI